MPNLYIIAGPNGAGKTTASYTVLPEILKVKQFVNADEIAKGISPFDPESVAFEAGRLMLNRIEELMEAKSDFAFETTLSTKSYVSFIKKARELGYKINLLFFWISSPELAKQRVAKRVSEGGHNIPVEVIERRYRRGIYNLNHLYKDISDYWLVIDNDDTKDRQIIAEGEFQNTIIHNSYIWKLVQQTAV